MAHSFEPFVVFDVLRTMLHCQVMWLKVVDVAFEHAKLLRKKRPPADRRGLEETPDDYHKGAAKANRPPKQLLQTGVHRVNVVAVDSADFIDDNDSNVLPVDAVFMELLQADRIQREHLFVPIVDVLRDVVRLAFGMVVREPERPV